MRKIIVVSKESCKPCSLLHNFLDGKEIPYEDVEYVTENIDKYKIWSVPTIILLEDDREIDRVVGFKVDEIEVLASKLTSHYMFSATLNLEPPTQKMRVKLTLPNAKPPIRANPTDAGGDLFSPVDIIIPAHSQVFINLGVQIELPQNTVGFIFARSGLGSKFGVRPRNGTGVIDQSYRGNLGAMMENHSDEDYHISTGDRILQLVVVPILTPVFEVVDDLTDTERGNGGFGSSGK
jgi:dUTP pyrophosphatase